MHENDIGRVIVDSAVKLHIAIGSGLLESVYSVLLADLLVQNGLFVEREVSIPITFGGRTFVQGFRADMIVENSVIVELKSVEQISRANRKQLLTYLRMSGLKLGYLLNFGADVMKNGISRVINGTL